MHISIGPLIPARFQPVLKVYLRSCGCGLKGESSVLKTGYVVMAKYGGFWGKPGRFWIVQSFMNGEWFYWEGVTEAVSNANVYSCDIGRAAQFLSEQAAHFAADMMGGPRLSRRVEEHVFQTSFVTE